MLTVSRTLWGVLALGLFGNSLSAAPVPVAAKVESKATKARAALEQKVTAKADNKTFTEAIEMFRELTKVEVILDVGVLQQVGMSADQQAIKFDVKDATVREAMKAAFGKYNLKCGVTAAGLVVSSDEGLIARQFRQRVSLDVDSKPLPDVMKSLAEESGTNLVLDPRIAKKAIEAAITLKLDDVPLETAVRLVGELAGYRVVRMSNVLLVTTDERAEKLKLDSDRPVAPSSINPVFPPDGGIQPFGPGGLNPGAVPAQPMIEVAPAVLPVEKN